MHSQIEGDKVREYVERIYLSIKWPDYSFNYPGSTLHVSGFISDWCVCNDRRGSRIQKMSDEVENCSLVLSQRLMHNHF